MRIMGATPARVVLDTNITNTAVVDLVRRHVLEIEEAFERGSYVARGGALVPPHSRCQARPRTFLAVRVAIAWIVRLGLTAPIVGNTEPSQIQRFEMSWVRQSGSTTESDGSDPMRHVPSRWWLPSLNSFRFAPAASMTRMPCCFTASMRARSLSP